MTYPEKLTLILFNIWFVFDVLNFSQVSFFGLFFFFLQIQNPKFVQYICYVSLDYFNLEQMVFLFIFFMTVKFFKDNWVEHSTLWICLTVFSWLDSN